MFSNNLLAGVSGQGGEYAIDNSLRFNDNDSAYLSRTPSVAGNRKTWTWSGWVKRGNVGATQNIFSIVVAGIGYSLRFETTNEIRLSFNNTASANIKTAATYTDVSGWYHIVATVDTTQATASDRINLYVNGQQVTSFSTSSYPSLNYQSLFNAAVAHNLGQAGNSSSYFDGYMAEINFIDGQALTADDFGEINEDTGEWSPKKYSGTYGTNGFYLAFEDGSALGDDTSGNANDWTPTNLASTDQMLDTPTNNFAVLNPLASDKVTFQEGNLEATLLITDPKSAITTIPVSSGKWYAEVYYNSNTANALLLGVVTESYSPVSGTTHAWQVSSGGGSVGYFLNDGSKYIDGVTTAYGSSATTGDIIGIAFNLDDDEITFYKNNVSQGTITIKAFSGGYNFFLSNGTSGGNQVATLNQGADSSFAGNKTRQGNTDANGIGDFYYEPPAGFLALCEDNLEKIPFVATGGTITTVSDNGVNYKVHTFNSSGTFTVTSGYKAVEYLVVAGGGGGSSGGASYGGGGAGGYRSSVFGESSGGGANSEPMLNVSAGSYTVTVGSGGAPVTNGTNSVFGSITSTGGGGAGISDSNGLSGGSGGGAGMTTSASGTYTGGAGTAGQGFAGGNTTRVNPDYSGGGGGGAGSVGTNASPGVPGNGGAGVASSITGSSVTYASGGQGWASPGSVLGTGVAGNGATNTGEGGGSRVYNGTTYSGGSGIVVIRYAI